jgi:hypothetical protein
MARIEPAATRRPRTVALGDDEEKPDAAKQRIFGNLFASLAS